MRFCADLHLGAEELELVKPIEQNALKHMTVVNDICSFGKERMVSSWEPSAPPCRSSRSSQG